MRSLRLIGFLLLSALLFSAGGCYRLMSSEGGGQTRFQSPRPVDPGDVALPDGYRMEVVATQLTFPTGVTFDEEGHPYVTEAGYSYGSAPGTPRLVRIQPNGEHEWVARGENPPWNGVAFHEGSFYVAGGHPEGGQVLRIAKDGTITRLVEGLPSYGDHHTNGPVIGPDGHLYIGQGTATNAAVVGVDNFHYGWLQKYPDFHDTPCRDVVLAGKNYVSSNPLTDDPEDQVRTGAYVPFGTATEEGQVIDGQIPCSGAIFRLRLPGDSLELVAWGFRNPFGLAFAPDDELYITENGYDDRGSRPAWGTGDYLWRIEPDTWYGWPDFAGGVPLSEFDPPGEDAPSFVLAEHPNEPPQPVAQFGVHSSSNGMDFSHSAAFGYEGDAFVAQFGDMAPQVGKVVSPVGFRVVRVDLEEGVVHGFATNKDGTDAPASKLDGEGLERPVSVRFSPDGEALYVVDFGVLTMTENGPQPRPRTGVLWRITREKSP